MSSNITLLILFLAFFTLATINISFTNGSSNISCIESEKHALLIFKQHLIDPADRLAYWVHDEDCCQWAGVICDNVTGHVLELHLATPTLDYYYATHAERSANEQSKFGGKINHSLLKLNHLSHLDLSNNNFGGIHIPKFFGFMGSLRYLNLSHAGFGGLIPHQLGNLSNMQYLDLRDSYTWDMHVENLSWLSGISQLKYLDMSYVNLSLAFDWLYVVNKHPSLKKLHFSSCELPPPSTVLKSNMSSLVILDLNGNYLDNSHVITSWISNLKTLVSLDLGSNVFEGPIPVGLQNLTYLRHLNLSDNNFNSSIPEWLYSFSSLEFLSLGRNSLRGNISSGIGNMTKTAISLDLSYNDELVGGIPRSIGNLCNLRSLSLSGMNLSQKISDVLQILSVCVSDGLESLDLHSCQLSGQLTDHLGYFKNLKYLFLDNNLINGSIPKSFGQLASLKSIDISYNLLEDVVNETHFAKLTKLKHFAGNGNSLVLEVQPNWIPPFQLKTFYTRSWNLGYQFPKWLHSQKELVALDISNSGISDSIPRWFWSMSSQLCLLNVSNNQMHGKLRYIPTTSSVNYHVFDFSSNSFSGSLPRISSNLTLLHLAKNLLSGSLSYFLCNRPNEMMNLKFLDLSENLLVGDIPDCWMKWSKLKVIRFDSNNFTGVIPSSLGNNAIRSLHLHRNRLSGELPLGLKNSTNLLTLDFSENGLNGQIPEWLGLNLQNLRVLILHSNKFHGHIPVELCAIGFLQILDLSHNNLSGFLPKCIGNFSARDAPGAIESFIIHNHCNYCDFFILEVVLLLIKGNRNEFSTNLDLVRSIDLSKNNLQGRIPNEITRLQGLQSLNLSNNQLIGRIPQDIGVMTSLESIDFSVNQLSGPIPQSISNLTFLSHLNLSNNNLSGKIPSGTQLQSFDVSSYSGNRLCGPPMTKNCSVSVSGEIPSTGNEGKNDANGLEVDWFYVIMAIGFAVGFGLVSVPLMLSKWWREIYFRYLDRMWSKLVLLYVKASRFSAS